MPIGTSLPNAPLTFPASSSRKTNSGSFQSDAPDELPPKKTPIFLIIVVILIVLGSIGIYAIHINTQNTAKEFSNSEQSNGTIITPIRSKEAPIVNMDSIQIEHKWTLLAGKHPTVTLYGTAEKKVDRIERCFFAYKIKNDMQWMAIDARQKSKNHYSAKIRDLEDGTTYECTLIAITPRGNISSGIKEFKIKGK